MIPKKPMPRLEATMFDQIPLRDMERGLAKPIATVGMEPNEISKKSGLQFESAEDDLDRLEAALIHSKSGRQYALVRHEHQPGPGTDILTNEHSPRLTDDLLEVLQLLRIQLEDLTWIHPDIGVDRIRR